MPDQSNINKKPPVINLGLFMLIGLVGLITLLIVLAAVLGGLWLDSHFGTRPVITLVLLVLSMPISVLVMLIVLRSGIARIKEQIEQAKQNQPEEELLGKG